MMAIKFNIRVHVEITWTTGCYEYCIRVWGCQMESDTHTCGIIFSHECYLYRIHLVHIVQCTTVLYIVQYSYSTMYCTLYSTRSTSYITHP
jgi:hypothetical protein